MKSRRVILLHSSLMNARQLDLAIKLFLSKYDFPVYTQTWEWEDVYFHFTNSKYLWVILARNKKALIGYVSIDIFDNCFEIAIDKNFQNFGYSIDATILAIDYVLRKDLRMSKVITHIFHDNTIAIKTAIKFGWKYKEKHEEWCIYELSRDSFLNSKRINNLKEWFLM